MGSMAAMFPHKSLLYVCTVALTTSSPQSYFHNIGNQGTYTSVNHGSTTGLHHQHAPAEYNSPAPTAYNPPAPAAYSPSAPAAYKRPAPAYEQPAYHAPAPAPTIKSFYHAPVAKPAAYHAALPKPYVQHHQPRPSYHLPQPHAHPQPHAQPQPHAHPKPHAQPQLHAQPRPHGPGIEYDREKCAVDYVEKKAEVCVPTFKTDCEREDVKNGLVIKQQEECYQVTKTICTETEEIVGNEVCAYSFTLVPVKTEAKLVDVKWEKSCADDTVCLNPHHAPGGYAAPTHCVEEYRHVCHLSPALYPVIKKVVIKLPKPVETCINKQVLLPRLECDRVHERRCMLAPRTQPGPTIKLDKCSVVVGEPACSDTVLQLPRQGCLQKITKLRTIYEVEEHMSYSG